MSARCLLLLGGSFDPVHTGHVALARYFCTLLHPDELRLVPAGQPWQKPTMTTPAVHRIAMLERAFADWAVPVTIDQQEIRRAGPSFTVDTLRALRAEVGEQDSVVMVLGADQLLNLPTWRDWLQLFDLVHLCVAARPGFRLAADDIAPEVSAQFARRLATPEQLKQTPHGLTFIASQLAVDVSSTSIRQALAQQDPSAVAEAVPGPVLDYIQHHHLYQTH